MGLGVQGCWSGAARAVGRADNAVFLAGCPALPGDLACMATLLPKVVDGCSCLQAGSAITAVAA